MPKMYRPKRQQVGAAGLVVRYRNGTCAHSCRRCQHWQEWPRWRPAVRFARKHDTAHYANAVRYNRTSTDHRHLTASRARRATAPTAPSIVVVPTTAPGPAPEGYVPTPAGPPATDANGTWIPEPQPAPAP